MITVGSSDVAGILGLSPWATPGHVWARLTGLTPRYASGDTAATRRGRIIEPALIAEWGRCHGVHVVRGPTIDEPPRVRDGWKHAREDGLARVDGQAVVVEAKTTRTWDGWGADGSSDVPPHYAAQVAWQLHVLGADRAEIVAFCALDDDLRTYRIARDPAEEARIVLEVEGWMLRHVWGAHPVPPPDLPYEVTALAHADGGADKADVIPATDAAHAAAAAYRDAVAARAAAELAVDHARSELAALIGDHYGIDGVATWGRTRGRSTIDAQLLRERYPEVAAEVTKIGNDYRTLRVKGAP